VREQIRRLLEEGKSRATCHSARIAAVIETPRGERVVGWNGPPGRAGGHPRCAIGGGITPQTLRDCPAVHAEIRAICRASAAGIATEGSTLYLSEWFPCAPRAVAMVEAGVRRLVVASRIVYAKDDCYNFGLAREYLSRAGVAVEEW